MIVIANDDPAMPAGDLAAWITGGDLMFACVAEAERHAEALAGFDATLGRAIGALGRSVRGEPADPATVSALVADLQVVDRLRQEGEALARTLALVAALPSPATRIASAEVLACVPTGAQQARLLAARASKPVAAGSGS